MKITRRQLRKLINEHVAGAAGYSGMKFAKPKFPPYDEKLAPLAMSDDVWNQNMADELADSLGYEGSYLEDMRRYLDAQRMPAALERMETLGSFYGRDATDPDSILEEAAKICVSFDGRFVHNKYMRQDLIRNFANAANMDNAEVSGKIGVEIVKSKLMPDVDTGTIFGKYDWNNMQI